MTKDVLGKVFMIVAVVAALVCLFYPSIFLPEGDLYEPAILARNLVIISLLNWLFFLGLKLFNSQ